MSRRLWSRLAIVYGIALAFLAFAPIGWFLNRLTVRMYVIAAYHLHLTWARPEQFGALLNVFFFVPLGFLVMARWNGMVLTIMVSAGVSAAIEITQLVPFLHRQASVWDWVCNVLGGSAGALLLVNWLRFHRHESSAT